VLAQRWLTLAQDEEVEATRLETWGRGWRSSSRREGPAISVLSALLAIAAERP
jgi:hypothetical protein